MPRYAIYTAHGEEYRRVTVIRYKGKDQTLRAIARFARQRLDLPTKIYLARRVRQGPRWVDGDIVAAPTHDPLS